MIIKIRKIFYLCIKFCIVNLFLFLIILSSVQADAINNNYNVPPDFNLKPSFNEATKLLLPKYYSLSLLENSADVEKVKSILSGSNKIEREKMLIYLAIAANKNKEAFLALGNDAYYGWGGKQDWVVAYNFYKKAEHLGERHIFSLKEATTELLTKCLNDNTTNKVDGIKEAIELATYLAQDPENKIANQWKDFIFSKKGCNHD